VILLIRHTDNSSSDSFNIIDRISNPVLTGKWFLLKLKDTVMMRGALLYMAVSRGWAAEHETQVEQNCNDHEQMHIWIYSEAWTLAGIGTGWLG